MPHDPVGDSHPSGPPPADSSSAGTADGPPVVARDPQGYWRANRRLIAMLLVVWATVSYGCGVLLVEPLNRIQLGDLPLGFWFAQQGSIYVFVILIFVYALVMDRYDRKFGVRE